MGKAVAYFTQFLSAAACAAVAGMLLGCRPAAASDGPSLRTERAGDSAGCVTGRARARRPVRLVNLISVHASRSPAADMIRAVLNGNVSRIDELRAKGISIDAVYCFSEGDRFPSGTRICLTSFLRGFDLQLIHEPGDWGDSYYRIYPKAADRNLPYGYVRLYGTPLMVACRAGNHVMVKALLERGANPNVFIETRNTPRIPDCISRRPLIYAYSETFLSASKRADSARRRMKADAVAAALKASGIVFPGVDGVGRNAVFDALEAFSPSFLETAIRNGCDVNVRDRHGLTACDWVSVNRARLSKNPDKSSKRLQEILDEELRILMKNGAAASSLDESDLKRMAARGVPSVQGMIDRLEAEDRCQRDELARFIQDIDMKTKRAEREAEIELARNEARWKAMEQEWRREIDHNRVYPGMSYEDWNLAREQGLTPVCAGSAGYGGYHDPTLFRDGSGDFYKVEGGFIQRYNDDGSLGPARRSK